MTYRKRADKNHSEISVALRKIGCKVLDLSRVGGGVPDILVRRPDGCLLLLELKTSTGRLNEKQKLFHNEWSGSTFVVRTPMEAVETVTGYRHG